MATRSKEIPLEIPLGMGVANTPKGSAGPDNGRILVVLGRHLGFDSPHSR
jgi:hypothetical protein